MPAGLVLDEKRQMVSIIGGVGEQRQLRAENGLDTVLAGGADEARCGVDGVVVSQGQGGQAQLGRAGDQLFGMARAVEETVVRVAVQLGVAGLRVAQS